MCSHPGIMLPRNPDAGRSGALCVLYACSTTQERPGIILIILSVWVAFLNHPGFILINLTIQTINPPGVD